MWSMNSRSPPHPPPPHMHRLDTDSIQIQVVKLQCARIIYRKRQRNGVLCLNMQASFWDSFCDLQRHLTACELRWTLVGEGWSGRMSIGVPTDGRMKIWEFTNNRRKTYQCCTRWILYIQWLCYLCWFFLSLSRNRLFSCVSVLCQLERSSSCCCCCSFRCVRLYRQCVYSIML